MKNNINSKVSFSDGYLSDNAPMIACQYWQNELCRFFGYDPRVAYIINYACDIFADRIAEHKKVEEAVFDPDVSFVLSTELITGLVGHELSMRTLSTIRKSITDRSFFKWEKEYERSPLTIHFNAGDLAEYLRNSKYCKVGQSGVKVIVKFKDGKRVEDGSVNPKPAVAKPAVAKPAVAKPAVAKPAVATAATADAMDVDTVEFEITRLLNDRKLEKELREAIGNANSNREDFLKSYYQYVVNDMNNELKLTTSYVGKGFRIHAKYLKDNGGVKKTTKRNEYPSLAKKYVAWMRESASHMNKQGYPSYRFAGSRPYDDADYKKEEKIVLEMLQRNVVDKDTLSKMMAGASYGVVHLKFPIGKRHRFMNIGMFHTKNSLGGGGGVYDPALQRHLKAIKKDLDNYYSRAENYEPLLTFADFEEAIKKYGAASE